MDHSGADVSKGPDDGKGPDRVVLVGDTLWVCGSGTEVRLKDLGPVQASELLDRCGTQELVGKTVVATFDAEVSGAWGAEPIRWLVFADGTAHGFVLPADVD